jgi:hypothetical protein
VEAKRGMLEDRACSDCIRYFGSTSVKAASDSASRSRTASTVRREIGMPRVVLVCGEMKRMIDSIFSGIAFTMPTYLPPPAFTIDDISASLKHVFTAFPSGQDLYVASVSVHMGLDR